MPRRAKATVPTERCLPETILDPPAPQIPDVIEEDDPDETMPVNLSPDQVDAWHAKMMRRWEKVFHDAPTHEEADILLWSASYYVHPITWNAIELIRRTMKRYKEHPSRSNIIERLRVSGINNPPNAHTVTAFVERIRMACAFWKQFSLADLQAYVFRRREFDKLRLDKKTTHVEMSVALALVQPGVGVTARKIWERRNAYENHRVRYSGVIKKTSGKQPAPRTRKDTSHHHESTDEHSDSRNDEEADITHSNVAHGTHDHPVCINTTDEESSHTDHGASTSRVTSHASGEPVTARHESDVSVAQEDDEAIGVNETITPAMLTLASSSSSAAASSSSATASATPLPAPLQSSVRVKGKRAPKKSTLHLRRAAMAAAAAAAAAARQPRSSQNAIHDGTDGNMTHTGEAETKEADEEEDEESAYSASSSSSSSASSSSSSSDTSDSDDDDLAQRRKKQHVQKTTLPTTPAVPVPPLLTASPASAHPELDAIMFRIHIKHVATYCKTQIARSPVFAFLHTHIEGILSPTMTDVEQSFAIGRAWRQRQSLFQEKSSPPRQADLDHAHAIAGITDVCIRGPAEAYFLSITESPDDDIFPTHVASANALLIFAFMHLSDAYGSMLMVHAAQRTDSVIGGNDDVPLGSLMTVSDRMHHFKQTFGPRSPLAVRTAAATAAAATAAAAATTATA
jgi:hypothetical protein